MRLAYRLFQTKGNWEPADAGNFFTYPDLTKIEYKFPLLKRKFTSRKEVSICKGTLVPAKEMSRRQLLCSKILRTSEILHCDDWIHTTHILVLFMCKRRQGLGLLLILLNNSIKKVRTRTWLSFISEHSKVFLFSVVDEELWQSADTGENGCGAWHLHSTAWVGLADFGPLQLYIAFLVCGTTTGNHKNFVLFHICITRQPLFPHHFFPSPSSNLPSLPEAPNLFSCG